MFRISFFCEDKDLASIMHNLAGKAKGMECLPVAGSNPTLSPVNGGGRQTQLRRADIVQAGGAPQMLVKIMRQQKLTEVLPAKVKELCAQMGLSKQSYSHLLHSAVKEGLIKRGPKSGNGFLWRLTEKAGDK